jgi:arylsulfatase A-like enzyme
LPSIVLVLADDLSMDLVRTMGEVQRMSRRGATYRHSYVVDSLCCPSRASLITGQYPHQTGVLTNDARPPYAPRRVGPAGGWPAFRAHGNVRRSVNVRLRKAGYTTGFVGKYLNRYERAVPTATVPRGWSSWHAVLANAYNGWEFGVTRSRRGKFTLHQVDAPPANSKAAKKDRVYAGKVIADRAVRFIRNHRAERAPYFLVVSTYAPHGRPTDDAHYRGDPIFPPAFRDRARGRRPGNCGPVPCHRIGIEDVPGYRDDASDNVPRRANGRRAPQWRRTDTPSDGVAEAFLRTRAQMAQSIDRMLRRIRRVVGPDTYVVFTSDNGFHIGQHGPSVGKGTPFVSDTRVPLVITGPHVKPGVRRVVVSQLDLAPTFEDLAGLHRAPYRAGYSLVPTLRHPSTSRRRFAYFEHTWAPPTTGDPDARAGRRTGPDVPSYVAVRNRTSLLVRFDLDPRWRRSRHAWEFYDYTRVGWERTNEYGQRRHRQEIRTLKRRLRVFERCASHTGDDPVPRSCRRRLS